MKRACVALCTHRLNDPKKAVRLILTAFFLSYRTVIYSPRSISILDILFVAFDPTDQPVLVHDDPVSFHNSREPGQMRYGICQTVRYPECLYQAIWGKYIGKRSERPEFGSIGVRLLIGQPLE